MCSHIVSYRCCLCAVAVPRVGSGRHSGQQLCRSAQKSDNAIGSDTKCGVERNSLFSVLKPKFLAEGLTPTAYQIFMCKSMASARKSAPKHMSSSAILVLFDMEYRRLSVFHSLNCASVFPCIHFFVPTASSSGIRGQYCLVISGNTRPRQYCSTSPFAFRPNSRRRKADSIRLRTALAQASALP